MTQQKRGQAALEFLTTYGWAFLVILIMISALAYFGVLSPTNFIPDRCVVPPGFSCEEFRMQHGSATNATIEVILRNQQGETINLAGARTLEGEFTDPNTCTIPSGQVASQASFQINCTSASGDYPAEGEKILTQMEFNYTKVGGQFTQIGNIELFGPLQ